MLNWILTGILASLQILDFLSTKKILANGGRELNPLMLKLVSWLGQTKAMILTKAGAVIAAIGATIMLGNDVRLTIALLAITAVYGVVVANNFKVLKNLK